MKDRDEVTQPNEDAEAVAALIRGRPAICTRCIAKRLDMDAGYLDIMLVHLRDKDRTDTRTGTCQECGRNELLVRADFAAPRA